VVPKSAVGKKLVEDVEDGVVDLVIPHPCVERIPVLWFVTNVVHSVLTIGKRAV
jgi:hypothetical protein